MQASLANMDARNNMNVAMDAQAGLDLSIDQQVQRYGPN